MNFCFSLVLPPEVPDISLTLCCPSRATILRGQFGHKSTRQALLPVPGALPAPQALPCAGAVRGLSFPGIQAPRTPSFNEADVSDKPAWVQRLPRLDATAVRAIDTIYRKRRQCTQAVDDMVERLIGTPRNTGQLSNTYVFFTSDNGFFHGQHRIPDDKRRVYEEAIRAPLVVRGPDIPAGRVVYRSKGNVDFAPTFAALAGVTPPSLVDGRSLVPLFSGTPPIPWRQAFLLESQPVVATSADLAYAGLRTARRQSFVLYDSGEGEYYDLGLELYQLENRYGTMSVGLKGALAQHERTLQTAAGVMLRWGEEVVAEG